jgi:uncharacterized protein (TIGR00661 family)
MKKVIVAPLNWGLGHASRCIPMIKELQKHNLQPIIASDGEALKFLQQEFPKLEIIELPSYKISYGKHLKWKLLKKSLIIRKAVKEESQIIHRYLKKNSDVVGIISDNRFGVRSTKVPSVYITHQINVLAGFWTPITSWVHQRIIQKFDECWIPDEENSRFSGKLSQSSKKLNQRFIGVLSRFEKKNHEKSIDLLIVLSGPEPNRSQLEEKLIDKFSTTELNVCFVQGNVTSQRKEQNVGNLTLINYVLSEELEILLNTAKYVICRSGYSSIMDLAALGKSALLIPTKGQTEQEYLAKYHSKQNRFEVISESELKAIEMDVNRMSSEEKVVKTTLPADLFRLFQRE